MGPYAWHAIILFSGLCLLMCLALECSFRLGKRQMNRYTAEGKALLQTIYEALLTLVALLLAFGVSMAETRYEARLQNLTDEGNAFSSSYLRATLLPASLHKPFREALARNLEARIEFYNAASDVETEAAIQRKTDQAQNALWRLVSDSARKNPVSTSLPLVIQGLNETIDIQEKQARAYTNHLPLSVLILLLVASELVMAGTGFLCGLNGKRYAVFTNLAAVVIGMTLFVIIDLDRPQAGGIQIRPNNLIQHLKSFSHPGS